MGKRDMNRVDIIGRLTSDPELKYTPAGTPVCNFSIANNDSYTKDGQKIEKVSFFSVIAWTKLAELCGQYLSKGKQIALGGRLQQRRWEYEGKKHSKIEIIAADIQFLGSPSNQQQTQQQSEQQAPVQQESVQQPTQQGPSGGAQTGVVVDDDIPF